ncbi:MAG: benzoate transporter [Acidimicrobiia bacterium]|nr:benzoate transporter [Acidimicrobiia bacterium]
MDTHAYDQWFELWTEDARYWIPCNEDDHDTRIHVSLVHEDYEGLTDRIARLNSGAAWSQDPKSRLCRVVSNIELAEGDSAEVLVHSTFNLTAIRRGRTDIIAGRNQHRLRRVGDGLAMVSKTVVLVDNNEVMNNLTFLI